MSYRDDLGAAHARNEALEKELAEAKAALVLRNEKPAKGPSKSRDRARLSSGWRGRAAGYLPLWPLCRATISDAFEFTAGIKLDGRKPRTILGWALYSLGMPLLLLTRILFLVLLTCLFAPWAALLGIAGSLPLFPVVLLSRLRLGGMPIFSRPAWFTGPPTDGEIQAYTILVIVTIFAASMLLLAML